MNLAFPAAFLFAVLLPGLIFRRTYHQGFLTAPPPEPLADEIARSPIPAAIFHLTWGGVCELIGRPIDVKAAIALVLGNFGKKSSFFDTALDSIADHVGEISVYFLSICGGALIVGYICHWVVWGQGLDLKFRFLRSNDYWFYLFRGELLQPRQGPIAGVRVSAVVPGDNQTLIYRGIFRHYTGRGGRLDEIWLLSAERRFLSEDNPDDPHSEKFYRIPGDLLILRASELRTINLAYIYPSTAGEALTSSPD